MPKTSKRNKTRILVLTADQFEDLELLVPVFRFIEAGLDVTVAAPEKKKIEGEHGYALEAHEAFENIDPAKFDLLFLPGGSPDGAPTTVRRHPKAQAIAKAFFAKDKPVAAICHGPYTLVSAGLVKGRKLTSFWGDGVPDEIKAAGGEYVDAEVVVDGNLVSSRYPFDLPYFMREVMKQIGK